MALAGLRSEEMSARGAWSEAFETLAPALDVVTERPPGIIGQLGLIALQSGRPQEAVDLLEGLSRSRERTMIKFRLGRAYEDRITSYNVCYTKLLRFVNSTF